MRSVPKWVVKENVKIIKEREDEARKRAYETGCSEAKYNICSTFWDFEDYTPNCIDYDRCRCPFLLRGLKDCRR